MRNRSPACVSIILVLAILSAIVGCSDPGEYEQLHKLSSALKASGFRDTILWDEVTKIRPTIINLNDRVLDDAYNSLVQQIVESDSLYRERVRLTDWRGLLKVPAESKLDIANTLRYSGSYNAARSMYNQAVGDDPNTVANIEGNRAMEYERVGLIRTAIKHALRSDSIFKYSNWHKGRLWTQRMLYSLYSKLGARDSAIECLAGFRRHFLKVPGNARIDDDTVTIINLIHSILQVGHADSDLKRAFGKQADYYLFMYNEVIGLQPVLWRNTWFSATSASAERPKPIIRELPIQCQLALFTDSIIPADDGQVAYDTRFGSYVLQGDRWVLAASKYSSHSHSLKPSSVPRHDTILSVNDSIRAVFPIGSDTLIVLAGSTMIQVVGRSITYSPMPTVLRQAQRQCALTRIDGTRLLAVTPTSAHVLRLPSYEPLSTFKFDTCSATSIWMQGRTSIGIIKIKAHAFLVQDRSASRLLCLEVDPFTSAINSIDLVTNREAVEHWSWSSIEWNLAFREELDQRLGSGSLRRRYAIRKLEVPWGYINRNVARIQAPGSLVALHLNDQIDVIDTTHNLVYPQFSLPIPYEVSESNRVGIFLDSMGLLRGYRHDEYVLTGFALSQRGYRLSPQLMVADRSAQMSPLPLHQVRVLEANHTYSIYPVISGLLFGCSPDVRVKRSGAEVMVESLDGSRGNRQYMAEPIDDFVTVALGTSVAPVQIAVTTPLFHRPWFWPVVTSVIVTLILVSVSSTLRSQRQRRLKAIHEAKSQQLELIREDMHDMIGSRLVRIASLARQAKPEDADAALARIHDMTLVTVRSLRNLLSLMSETTMTDAEFFGALREYVVESCTDAALIPTVIVNTIDDKRTTLDGGDRHELMMIVSEMLANTLRHAQARTVTFSILSDAFGITLEWQDDGIGIAPSSQRGNGLNNIQRRAARLDATVNLVSHPGSGTQYTISIPIQAS